MRVRVGLGAVERRAKGERSTPQPKKIFPEKEEILCLPPQPSYVFGNSNLSSCLESCLWVGNRVG